MINRRFKEGEVETRGPVKRVRVFLSRGKGPTPEELSDLLPPSRQLKLDERLLRELGCPRLELGLFRQLNTPQKVQTYINRHFKYTDDYIDSFMGVVKTKEANCFSGSVGFALPLLWFHGYEPRLLMMVADNDRDENHNVVAFRDRRSGLIGSVAMSSWDTLKDRPPMFSTFHHLVMAYWQAYTSAYAKYAGEHTLIGYSDPVDIAGKYGWEWLYEPGRDPRGIHHIYNTYAKGLMCTALFDPTKRFIYPEAVNTRELERQINGHRRSRLGYRRPATSR